MESLASLSKIIKDKDFFYILTHIYPDGDAMGSAFALCRALQKMGKHSKVLCNDSIPQKFDFLSAFVKKEEFDSKYIISVDLADTSLLGPNLEKYSSKIDMCIDHHPSNKNYAALNYVDSAAAANCEIIYKLLKEINEPIDKEIATCLYTGIATDTGCFEYSNTTAKSHFIAAELMNIGAPVAEINEKIFTVKSEKKLSTENTIYKNLEYFFDGKCALTFITLKEMQFIGTTDNELDGIASIPIKIEGVQLGITIREKASGIHKVSVRTKGDVDSNLFCSYFGGGGHSRAGGFNIEGTVEKAKSYILDTVKSKLGW